MPDTPGIVLKSSEYGQLLAERIQENLRLLVRTALGKSAHSPKLTVRAIAEMVGVELAHLPCSITPDTADA